MTSCDRVLALLAEREGGFVSGDALAQSLSLSRSAVWKAVAQLRRAGYDIDAATRRGYCLRAADAVLSEAGIRRHLRHPALDLRVFDELDSTNAALKRLAEEGAPEGLALIAEAQTQGRGRMGRSFYSPGQSGLYLSLLLRPRAGGFSPGALTACAAVAVAEAIEAVTGLHVQIKWVNDLLLGGKKVCGILTEGALDCEAGRLRYAVLGVGVNVCAPKNGFPEELQTVAGALFDDDRGAALRCRLAAEILDRLWALYAQLPETGAFWEAYRARCDLPGKPIHILALDAPPQKATALAIAPDFSLLVELPDGTKQSLRSGEVSVRSAPDA